VHGRPRPARALDLELTSHASQIWALDFTSQVMWNFGVCCVLVILALDSRRVVYVAVTSSPTLAWVQQQLRDATPWGEVPRFLIHVNDGIFGQFRPFRAGEVRQGKRYRCALDRWLSEVLSVRGILIPCGAPNASPHVERFTRTLKQECLQHFVFFSEDQLRRTVTEFVGYYNEARPHQGIADIPDVATGQLPARVPEPEGRLTARPILSGIAHDYSLAA